ncbi:MAG: HAD family hydrolase [Gammaproteobacteria bacterium]|nr:HAD family hydrolase [Gammaproteobacteria bacterium]
MLRQITIIAFDLDDTLWPCQQTIEYAEETLYIWLAARYPRITERYSRSHILARRKQFIADYPAYSVDMSLMRRQFLRLLAAESDYDADAVENDGFEVFFQARQQVTFYDDVLPCMQRLKQQYRLGSISNGNASVKHVGLGHMIEHAVSASDLNVAKPDKRIYHRLAQCFETEVSRILYVGDHPHYDVVGPESAGMPAVWMNRENADWPDDLPKPRHEVSDLVQLEVLLKSC